MTVKILTEHHLECLSLKVSCTGLSESTHVKMPHCWKSHVVAHMVVCALFLILTVSLAGLRCVNVTFPAHFFSISILLNNISYVLHNSSAFQFGWPVDKFENSWTTN